MKRNKSFEWTEDRIERLKELFPIYAAKDIAERLGCTKGAVYSKTSSLGMKKSKEWRANRSRQALQNNPNHGAWKTTFKKGRTPSNKGKKMHEYMSPKSIEKTKNTRFAKGHKPHTHMPGLGHITKRFDSKGIPYLYIKTAEAKWELYSNYLWIKEHGSIPKGHIITYKDLDSLNCTIENLECISKAEHLRRNRYTFEKNWDKEQAKRAINKQLLKLKYSNNAK